MSLCLGVGSTGQFHVWNRYCIVTVIAPYAPQINSCDRHGRLGEGHLDRAAASPSPDRPWSFAVRAYPPPGWAPRAPYPLPACPRPSPQRPREPQEEGRCRSQTSANSMTATMIQKAATAVTMCSPPSECSSPSLHHHQLRHHDVRRPPFRGDAARTVPGLDPPRHRPPAVRHRRPRPGTVSLWPGT
jgi:hypothetical protein